MDFHKVDLMALGITQNAFHEWAHTNEISGESDYFMHPRVAGLAYFVDEDTAAGCKLLATKYDKDIEMK